METSQRTENRLKHRLYLEALADLGRENPKPRSEFELIEGRSHYLRDVLRLRPDDTFLGFDGEGNEYVCCVIRADKRSVRVRAMEHVRSETRPLPRLVLAQAIIKSAAMDNAMQKSCELGVDAIVPVTSKRTNIKLNKERSDRRLEHWRGVVCAGAEQSGRCRLPQVSPRSSLPETLDEFDDYQRLFFHPGQQPALNLDVVDTLVCIGPEGGWTDEEVELAEQKGCRLVGFGNLTLRADTAAIAALTMLQSAWQWPRRD